MKKLATFLVLISCLTPLFTFAQGNSSARGRMPSNGHVYGKIIDGTSGKGVGFATVGVLNAKDSSTVTGVLSEENGDFNINNLAPGKYILQVKFIGYAPVYHSFSLAPGSMSKDLGNFKLSASTATLKGVDVTAQRPAYTMGIDKKVYDVSKSLTSVGGDATDVLKQVPSVNVDIDGNVTLRNGSPTIFIDGKQTNLTLDQIPAETIEKIEIITNPSAKYSAEGMSGIINIILKKNRKPGINGRLQAGADTRGGYNAGGNLNIYKKPLNLSLSYFRHHRNSPSSGTTNRTNYFDNSILNQNSDGKRYGDFQMGRIGLDYFLDNRNTLSFEGGIGGGTFNGKEDLTSKYFDADHSLDSSSERNTFDERTFRFYFGTLSYKHTFEKEGHELSGDIHVSKNNNGGSGRYQTQFYDNTGKPMSYSLDQKNNSDGDGIHFEGQIDYINPVSKNSKFEAGLKSTYRSSNSTYSVYDIYGNDYLFNDLLSSDYTFDETINAAYIQFSSKINKLGYQLGLRTEQYSYKGAIPSEGLNFEPESDKLGLYPSAFLTYKFSESNQLQLNYSRRVERPRWWQRIPYTDYSDPQNLRKGNPDLEPEYTNSLELSYNKIFGQSNFMATIYFRNTNNEITQFTEPYHNSKDTLIRYAINANTNNSFGGEFTLQTQITNWWNVTANLNLFQSKISANVKSQEFSNSRLTWFAKLNSEARLPANFSIQLNADWSGPEVNPQGIEYHYGSVDLGVKKDFLKKKNLSATLSFSDIFNTNEWKGVSEVPDVFSQTRIRRRASQFVRLNLSYTFGKQNFQLFRRKAKSPSGGGDVQGMQPEQF